MTQFGKVLIITNGRKGWVEYSSYFLLPRVHSLIKEKIMVISAQEDFSKKFPDDTHKWKELAFEKLWDVEGLLDKNCLLNLITIGDADYEINAGRQFKKNAYKHFTTKQRCILKLIKLKEEPSP
jgi:hypothetical protein